MFYDVVSIGDARALGGGRARCCRLWFTKHSRCEVLDCLEGCGYQLGMRGYLSSLPSYFLCSGVSVEMVYLQTTSLVMWFMYGIYRI